MFTPYSAAASASASANSTFDPVLPIAYQERHLKGKDFFHGNTLTIADIAVMNVVDQVKVK